VRARGRYENVGVQRLVAFGRRHVWPVSAAAIVAIVSAMCGIVLSVQAMIRGPFLVGYFGAAACGDLLIWGVLIIAALWLPRKSAPTA
jgi:hypothetical protein